MRSIRRIRGKFFCLIVIVFTIVACLDLKKPKIGDPPPRDVCSDTTNLSTPSCLPLPIIVSGLSESSGGTLNESVQLGLNFSGSYVSSMYYSYGEMHVKSFKGVTCEIPPGYYQLFIQSEEFIQPEIDIDPIRGLILSALHPVPVELRVSELTFEPTQLELLSCSKKHYSYNMTGHIYVQSVNNQDCGSEDRLTLTISQNRFSCN